MFTTGRRVQLQTLLEKLLGSSNVYFQPPPTIQMEYPCIVYNIDNADSDFADNIAYNFTWRYQVTVIDRNPDTPIRDAVASLPKCLFSRYFAANNLNHYVFVLYF